MPHVTISLHGAAGEVTGSCSLVETPTARVVIDFGLYQGTPENEARNHVMPAIEFARVDAVVVTHAHVDHCGRLGLLPSLGYDGAIFASEPTVELLPFVLRGSASLQKLRVEEWHAKSAPKCEVLEPASLRWSSWQRHDEPRILYGHQAAGKVVRELVALPWSQWQEIAPGVRARLHHASHMLGAASVELECAIPGGTPVRVLFSGDIGAQGSPVLAPHRFPDGAIDAVVMESTNGARPENSRKARGDAGTLIDAGLSELRAFVEAAQANRGKILLPSFAVGRSQLLVHAFAQLSKDGSLGEMPVFLDSGMASRACGLMGRWPNLLAAPLQRARLAGADPMDFEQLRSLRSREESAVIDGMRSACAVIAGSGFCDAGPMLRHLARALPRESTTLLFAGHVLHDTLAWGLRQGATKVAINGAEVDVRATVGRVPGFSGHASLEGLTEWLSHVPGSPRVILNHGTDAARDGAAAAIVRKGSPAVTRPAIAEPVGV